MALVRPGRVDMNIKIEHCSDYQLENMFSRFYPQCPPEHAQRFVTMARKLNPGKSLSPAGVQGHFMFHKNDPEEAIKKADLIN